MCLISISFMIEGRAERFETLGRTDTFEKMLSQVFQSYAWMRLRDISAEPTTAKSASANQVSRSGFIQKLQEIVSDWACNLSLAASGPKSEAIAEGLQLAGRAASIDAALLPLHGADTGSAKVG